MRRNYLLSAVGTGLIGLSSLVMSCSQQKTIIPDIPDSPYKERIEARPAAGVPNYYHEFQLRLSPYYWDKVEEYNKGYPGRFQNLVESHVKEMLGVISLPKYADLIDKLRNEYLQKIMKIIEKDQKPPKNKRREDQKIFPIEPRDNNKKLIAHIN